MRVVVGTADANRITHATAERIDGPNDMLTLVVWSTQQLEGIIEARAQKNPRHNPPHNPIWSTSYNARCSASYDARCFAARSSISWLPTPVASCASSVITCSFDAASHAKQRRLSRSRPPVAHRAVRV